MRCVLLRIGCDVRDRPPLRHHADARIRRVARGVGPICQTAIPREVLDDGGRTCLGAHSVRAPHRPRRVGMAGGKLRAGWHGHDGGAFLATVCFLVVDLITAFAFLLAQAGAGTQGAGAGGVPGALRGGRVSGHAPAGGRLL